MKFILTIIIGINLLIVGCKSEDNPTSPSIPSINSIEEQINTIRPINYIRVYNYDGNNTYTIHVRTNPTISPSGFLDAYASKGFLIVVYSSNSYYYNLSRVIEIETRPNEINMRF